jgi:hypothetical protein
MRFEVTVYDALEGRLHITVEACDEHAAHDEANVVASERGYNNVTEIVVGVFE